jgi:hypothetical protein
MKRKDVFRMVRYFCVAGIAIFGLVAIIGTGSDDVKDATCVDGTVTGTYEFTVPNTIEITVLDAELPADISLSDLGFELNESYTYTYDNEDIATAMSWMEGGADSGWNWVRDGVSTGDYTGTWLIEDKEGIDYELTITGDPQEFSLKATKCLLD